METLKVLKNFNFVQTIQIDLYMSDFMVIFIIEQVNVFVWLRKVLQLYVSYISRKMISKKSHTFDKN